MSLLAGLSQQGDSIAAHNDDASAHGFGVYTVAQLNAFTSANRPIGCVYCSDCLTPEGVGSPVVWNGSAWVCTCSSLPATTDVLTFLRGVRDSGKAITSESTFVSLPSWLSLATASGTDAIQLVTAPDPGTVAWVTGSTVSGSVRSSLVSGGVTLSSTTYRSASAVLFSKLVSFSALSTETDEYSVRLGIGTTMGLALGANEISFVYDRGNVLGIGNTVNSPSWFAVTRAGSVNTVTNSGVTPSLRNTMQLLEILWSPAGVQFFINGVSIQVPQTNIPASTITMYFTGHILKSAGTSAISAYMRGPNISARF